jgi:hypothetical protein
VLWRFRQRPEIRAGLVSLSRDPDVAIHAMSALRRAVGNAAALPVLLQIAAAHADPRVRENAARAANKAGKAIATSGTN